MTDQQKMTRRGWFQFRLRTLLIFMMLCTIPFAWVASERAQRLSEEPVIKWIEEKGGKVNPPWAAAEPSWWQEQTDSWFGAPVRGVNLVEAKVSDLSLVAGLENLEELYLNNTQVTDLSPLVGLKNLIVLELINTPVSKEQVQMLQQALPQCEIVLEDEDGEDEK